MSGNPLRHLPSVDRLLALPGTEALIRQFGRPMVTNALRVTLDQVRENIKKGEVILPSEDELLGRTSAILKEWLLPTLRRVINATGVILHTNLGRAPLSEAAIEAIRSVGGSYSTLEFDLGSGRRGSRSVHAEALLQRVTGAESALVVNNNAAAVLLTLTELAGPTREHPQGRGVIISRGQLIEIGGGFRVPDVMAQSGARLVEVGTTNRTHLYDYEKAIEPDTALILHAHRSNFAMVGFTTEPTLDELIRLAGQHGLLVADDLGSGALIDTRQFGLAPEPLVQESLLAGVAVVTFSGDKLLGGPQAGILVGKAVVIERLKKHPLARAIRADKLCLAGLTATLIHYLKGEALTHIPVWQMISATPEELRKRAKRWASRLTRAGLPCELCDGESAIGGGSLPGETLPTTLLTIRVPSPDAGAAYLRAHEPPVIVRIEEERLVIDPRTVLTRDERELLIALQTLKESVL
jgi:L-seryl-tRNA(Ser) seleniumtransferase